MFTLWSFIGLGPTELLVLLVIILIMVGGSRLPKLMSGMQDGIHNFRASLFRDGLREDQVWQYNDGRQRQFDRPPKNLLKWRLWLALISSVLVFLLAAAGEGFISVTQALITLGVLLAAALAWWFCFGKKRS